MQLEVVFRASARYWELLYVIYSLSESRKRHTFDQVLNCLGDQHVYSMKEMVSYNDLTKKKIAY